MGIFLQQSSNEAKNIKRLKDQGPFLSFIQSQNQWKKENQSSRASIAYVSKYDPGANSAKLFKELISLLFNNLRNILDVDFLWKENRLRHLMSSPGAPSAGPSTSPSYSSGPSTPLSYSSRPSTPPNYSPRSSRNAECSNCKQLRGKISVLKETMNMHMHLEQHTVNSAALLHKVLNEMEKLDLE
nr:hypothetical protein [Tanacetum cinerariifolium]